MKVARIGERMIGERMIGKRMMNRATSLKDIRSLTLSGSGMEGSNCSSSEMLPKLTQGMPHGHNPRQQIPTTLRSVLFSKSQRTRKTAAQAAQKIHNNPPRPLRAF